jgi:3-deoxy-D-manno-octulosonic-acid transferase
MPWILNLSYAALILAVSPLLLYRLVVLRKYRDGWSQKFLGRLPLPTTNRPRIWFHAVSVGEVTQIEPVLNAVRKARPDAEIVVSTTTRTGLDVARKKFPTDVVCYFPLDFSWAVKTAIRRIRPSAIVLVELEFWPNFIFAVQRFGIPLALINGRISEKSFRGYRRIRSLVRSMLGCFDLLAVQNKIYADRLLQLGAPTDRLIVTGSIKFDGVQTDRRNAKTDEIRRSFGIADDEPVFIAGSTQFPEEEYALESWLAMRALFPKVRLVLVPRHKERFDEVARLVKSRALPLLRRSSVLTNADEGADRSHDESLPLTAQHPVLLLDTMGELAACWGLADVAFVGGSLTNRGGQNMIEPVAYGAAVMFGPNTRNFRDVVELLLANNAATVVRDRDELTATLRKLFRSPQAAAEQGRTAQKLVLSQQGATARTVERLLGLLPVAKAASMREPSRAA